jgi:hypothetical protein
MNFYRDIPIYLMEYVFPAWAGLLPMIGLLLGRSSMMRKIPIA